MSPKKELLWGGLLLLTRNSQAGILDRWGFNAELDANLGFMRSGFT